MFNLGFVKISQADRNKFCETIIETSAPRFDYFLMVVLSTLIVSFGLITDNVALIIGGMLVTPLLSPVLAMSLGIVINNFKVFFRSLRVFLMSALFNIFVATLVGLLNDFDFYNISLIQNMTVSYLTLLVAIVAGIAASYAWAKPGLSSTLPGIAIAVTLIPPMTAIGLAISQGNIDFLFLFLRVVTINVLGIILASILVFIVLDFYKARKKLIAEVKEEEKELKKTGVLT